MSTVGCYSMDVYCDGDDCRESAQITGRTEAACLRIARERGWSIGAYGSCNDGSRTAKCRQHRRAAHPGETRDGAV